MVASISVWVLRSIEVAHIYVYVYINVKRATAKLFNANVILVKGKKWYYIEKQAIDYMEIRPNR